MPARAIISSPAISNTKPLSIPTKHLEKKAEITYLKVQANGLIDLAELEAAITPKTILIALMYANNEIGTV